MPSNGNTINTITFNRDMMIALLAGRKTQTRRMLHRSTSATRCPYGSVGDALRVNEPIYVQPDIWKEHQDIQPFHYATEVNHPSEVEDYVLLDAKDMPAWASRANILIKCVRSEKIQDIAEYDALQEGVDRKEGCRIRESFKDVWDGIYGNWNDNPDVWVLDFRIVLMVRSKKKCET